MVMQLDTDYDSKLSYSEFAAALPDLADVDLSMTPDQVHVSIVDDDNIMVMWVTKDATATTTVQFSDSDSSNLTNNVYGSTHTYTAGGWKGVIHEVRSQYNRQRL